MKYIIEDYINDKKNHLNALYYCAKVMEDKFDTDNVYSYVTTFKDNTTVYADKTKYGVKFRVFEEEFEESTNE